MVPVTTSTASPPQAGDLLELTVGEVAHGGWCVARQDDTGWVIFVRHALPGERVVAAVTQVTARFARADATRILSPSPDRIAAPCRYARPDRCGGCDWQHVRLPAQRALKAAVIRQQLARIAGLDREVDVLPLAGDEEAGEASGRGWRTAVTFAVGQDGRPGLRKHRSHEIVGVDECLIAHRGVTAAGVTGQRWPGARSVEVSVVPATGERGILVTGRPDPRQLPEVPAGSLRVAGRGQLRGHGYLMQRAAGRDWRVSLGGFWQVHPAAADTLAAAVLAATQPQPGAAALDLYCGAGLFAGVLAEATGPSGSVLAVEQDAAAVRDARHNLRTWPWARVHRGDAAEVLARTGIGEATIAVLDPPRTGADRAVIDVLCQPGLQRIAYVSCDPATLARDLRLLLEAGGWQLTALQGYDAFPMTHHVECLAVLDRD